MDAEKLQEKHVSMFSQKRSGESIEIEKKADRLKKRKSSVGDRWRRHRRSALSETAIEEAEFIDVSGDDGRHG